MNKEQLIRWVLHGAGAEYTCAGTKAYEEDGDVWIPKHPEILKKLIQCTKEEAEFYTKAGWWCIHPVGGSFTDIYFHDSGTEYYRTKNPYVRFCK